MTATLYESHAMCSPYDRWHSTNYVRSHELYWMNCVCSLHMWQRGRCVAQQHGHGRWHASRVPLVNCSSPVESGLSVECGVYQVVVSSWDQTDDKPTNRCACGAPCAQEHRSHAGRVCPKTEMRWAVRISPSCSRHYWRVTVTKSNQRIPIVSDADIAHGRSYAFMSAAYAIQTKLT